ncbi:leucine-rich repeat protein [Perkinsela sp. CCAP 1560/4]|nr:leucine-rich repeat protein [Perkinsela sp. CCAP 1560/4]|eukprot:KNH03739.1 leucine-rich repeat protein [Perkinsela sp. CCAP 1560/4]
MSSIFLLLKLYCAADSSTDSKAKSFQDLCILHLTGGANKPSPYEHLKGASIIYHTDLAREALPAEDVCGWTGFVCEKGALISIQSFCIEMELEWDLAWFPSSVEKINMSQTSMNTHLPTRSLPKNLLSCVLEGCRLIGRLEIRTLPSKVIRLCLQGNFIVGNICLTNLPPTMQELDLRSNKVENVYVCAENVPPLFHSSILEQRGGRQARVVWIGGRKTKSNIFY